MDVTIMSTTAFRHCSPASRRSNTIPDFSFAPATRPLSLQSSDIQFSPDGDFVDGIPHHLPVLPPLLVGNQSSLNQNVVEDDFEDVVVSGVDLSTRLSPAADDAIGFERQPGLAAQASFLSLLCGQLLPLPDTGDVLVDLPMISSFSECSSTSSVFS